MSRSVVDVMSASIDSGTPNGTPTKYHKSERDRKLHFISQHANARYRLEGTDDETLTAWNSVLAGIHIAFATAVDGYISFHDGYQHYRLVCTTSAGDSTPTVVRYCATAGF